MEIFSSLTEKAARGRCQDGHRVADSSIKILVKLPVGVDGAFVELNGVFSLLEFDQRRLKLRTNSAETRITLIERQTDR